MGMFEKRERLVAVAIAAVAFGVIVVQQVAVGRAVARLEADVGRLSTRLDDQPRVGSQADNRPVRCVALADSAEISSQVLRGLEGQAVLSRPAAASPEPPSPAPAVRAAPPPSDPGAAEAAARARRLVADARTAGHWGDAQREELRALEPALETKVYRELVEQLSAAINGGTLAVDTSGMPF